MKVLIWLAVAAIFVPQGCLAETCPMFSQKDEATLFRLEQTWAKALEQRDVQTVACLLAPEFEDAGTNGALHDRSEMLAHIPERKPSLNHLQEMRAHILGETAYVRGMNRVTDASGKELARVRFTDIFVYRDGKWQAVAGQETMLSETH